MYDDELHAKASDSASNRKNAYLAQMQLGKVKKKSQDELNWIWVAHYEGYKEGYWAATGDDRFTTDPDKLKEKKHMTKQEPVGYVSEGEPDRLIAQKQTKTPLRNYRLFTHDVPLYTTPHTKVGCVECRVSGGHAFYCVACAKNLFGGYKK